jgi:hypothetical protein
MNGMRNSTLLAWLALEREAVWFYPFAGARVSGVADDARTAAASHRRTRDRLLSLVKDDTTTVRPSYDVGTLDSVDLDSIDAVSIAARDLEQRIQSACLAVVASSDGDDRGDAIAGLRTASLAEIAWSGEARAFPGMRD